MSDTWTPPIPFGDENGDAGHLLELRDLLRERQPWRDRAACAGMDVSKFYPENADGMAEAKAVCSTCPVQADCLADNLHEEWGTWGGTGQRERELLRRKRRAA